MAMRAEQKVCWDCRSLSPADRFFDPQLPAVGRRPGTLSILEGCALDSLQGRASPRPASERPGRARPARRSLTVTNCSPLGGLQH